MPKLKDDAKKITKKILVHHTTANIQPKQTLDIHAGLVFREQRLETPSPTAPKLPTECRNA